MIKKAENQRAKTNDNNIILTAVPNGGAHLAPPNYKLLIIFNTYV